MITLDVETGSREARVDVGPRSRQAAVRVVPAE